MSNNPIAFNPDTMTVSQLKECAETLRRFYGNLDRVDAGDVDTQNFFFHFRAARDDMLRKWGPAK